MFAQQVEKWVNKTKSQTRMVVGLTAIDMAAHMTRVQPSISYTGVYEEGKVPVLTQELFDSFVGMVGGSFAGRGRRALEHLLNDLTADNIQMGFTAPYAPLIEYGTSAFPGRYMVRDAVAKYPEFIKQNITYVRSQR